ncbi:YigZ family protein [uncultured Flavobacterium sp.]|uniref:IMPACT family protein n=1 Tax=uncultured Flavobacterium sp. TaxID=165435 RepID=UPI0030CA25F0|tara:strand:+ start:94 stop:696 length:603 start_codon:yes stop_codon:yes gene_type:complete
MESYKTISQPSEEVLFKEKNSKFFSYAFPVSNEDEVKEIILSLKKKHHTARHFCYAYQIGTENPSYRVNDDGEPNNSAGMPIYGQIQSFELTNTLIVVVRYFGGIKLGVGGLMSAYKTAAQLALENSLITNKTIDINFIISFDYKNLNNVMRVTKEKNIQITSQKMELNCEIEISVPKKNAQNIFTIFSSFYEVIIKKKC